jgi:hypothetical protein
VADLLVYLFVLYLALQLRRQVDGSDGRNGALTWLVRSVWLLAVGHLLVFVGSLLTEVGWGSLGLEAGGLRLAHGPSGVDGP